MANCASPRRSGSAPIGWRRGSASSSSFIPISNCKVLLSDDELDLAMREADVALRLREPSQPDLIRRRLFTVHFHLYASPDYLKRHGQPQTLDDLDGHRLLGYAVTAASFLDDLNALLYAGRDPKKPREPAHVDQQHHRLAARRRGRRRHRRAAGLPEHSGPRASCSSCRMR